MTSVATQCADRGESSLPAPQGQPQERPQSQSMRWWDIGVAVITLLMCVPGGASALDWAGASSGAGARLTLNLGVLAAFVLLYVVLGRAELRRGLHNTTLRPQSLAFVGLLLVVMAVGTAVEPSYATLQAIAHPMIWVTIPRYRDAVMWSGALAAAVGIGSAVAYVRLNMEAPYGTALVVAALSFGFSVAMGTWMSRIFEQSERHRLLAEQLQQTQREVAALSSEAGAATERERLSRELHDTLTQTLAGLVMLSEQATRALDAGDPDRARDRLSRVESAARDAVVEARELVAMTQPLGDGGLVTAIERVATRMRADTGLQIDCVIGQVDLGREDQVVVLRAVQEGLANARKHARASRIVVTLAMADSGEVVLRVADDGVGVNRQEQGKPGEQTRGQEHGLSGFGLSGLTDRVRTVGGDVHFGPGNMCATGGAVLEVRIPHREIQSSPTGGRSHTAAGAMHNDPINAEAMRRGDIS